MNVSLFSRCAILNPFDEFGCGKDTQLRSGYFPNECLYLDPIEEICRPAVEWDLKISRLVLFLAVGSDTR